MTISGEQKFEHILPRTFKPENDSNIAVQKGILCQEIDKLSAQSSQLTEKERVRLYMAKRELDALLERREFCRIELSAETDEVFKFAIEGFRRVFALEMRLPEIILDLPKDVSEESIELLLSAFAVLTHNPSVTIRNTIPESLFASFGVFERISLDMDNMQSAEKALVNVLSSVHLLNRRFDLRFDFAVRWNRRICALVAKINMNLQIEVMAAFFYLRFSDFLAV